MSPRLAFAAAVLCTFLAPALAADPAGPPIGATKYITSIQGNQPGEVDVDDYAEQIGAGESLTVTVSVSKKSTLTPSLVVLGPDGTQYTEASGDILSKASGRKLTLRKRFVVPKTGLWAARVAGKNDTEGEYKIIFKVKKAKPTKLKNETLGAGGLTADHTFEGVDGGLLQLTLSSKKSGELVTLRELLDPTGNDVPNAASPDGKAATAATLKGRKVQLKNQVLRTGGGPYVARVGIDGTAQGSATYNISLKVLPPPRAKTKGTQRLDVVEPRLDTPPTPARGIEGTEVFFDGANFVNSPDTRVRIGSADAQVLNVTPTRVTVTVPAGPVGQTVAVTVQNPDGQAAVLDDLFLYVPPPVITNLVNSSGLPQRGGAVAGADNFTLVGLNLEAGQTVRFGDETATVIRLRGDTEMDVRTPAATGGASAFVNVFVDDEFGRTAQSPFLYEYKFPPAFAQAPYSPALGGVSGGTQVTLTGSNFDITDALEIGGNPLSFQFISSTTLRFVSPALAAGNYSATITDKYGSVATGPDFVVKPAPTVTDLVDDGGAQVRDVHTTGGTVLRLLGTNFTQQDAVRVGNDPVASIQFVDAGELRIELPNTAQVGNVSISVEDLAAQIATSPFQLALKAPPSFAATPFTPPFGKAGGGTLVTVNGAGFEAADTFSVDGSPVATTFVDATSFTFVTSAALANGTYTTEIVDRLGLQVPGPSLDVKGPPTITGSSVVAGSELTTGEVSLHGGATVRVTGTNFRSDDTVKVGSTKVTTSNVTDTSFDLDVGPGTAGQQDISVTDQVLQSATQANAIEQAGYEDNTSNRMTAGSSTDDLSALRGAIGDLDGDGQDDDLVIVSDATSSPGSRYEYTRILLENGSGKLIDRTYTNFPGYGADYFGTDYWTATAVAVGDVDGSYDDIVIGDRAPVYNGYYYNNYNGVRMFTNDGTGRFSLDESIGAEAFPSEYFDDNYGMQYQLFSASVPFYGVGTPTSIAIGDLDGDGNQDVVVGTTRYCAAYWYTYGNYYDPTYYVTMGSTSDSHYANYNYYYSGGYYYYGAGTRFLLNETDLASSRFRDVTFERMPIPGTIPTYYTPAFVARDVKLGDIDKDNDLDIILAWDDPYSVSPYGVYRASAGYGSPYTNVATRVMENDGYGFFTDATSYWMPTGATDEFWQAHRTELADLDKDGDLDLVLLLEQSIDAYKGTATFSKYALRVLRNDGAATGFVDVTTTVLPTLPSDSDDNYRGTALAVRDVDGDGNLDILVGTTEALQNDDGDDIRRTRLLLGSSSFKFSDGTQFLPLPTDDSGEADDILLGQVVGGGQPELILLSETQPTNSASSEFARVLDWSK